MATRRNNAPDGVQRLRTISQNTTTRTRYNSTNSAAPAVDPATSSSSGDNMNNNSGSIPPNPSLQSKTSALVGSSAVASSSNATMPMRTLSRLESESNIQVVVRCRGRSAREKAEGSANVVNIDSNMSNEVVIQTSAPKTELGVTTPANTRTYSFDKVIYLLF
jgi:kinesin family protein 11